MSHESDTAKCEHGVYRDVVGVIQVDYHNRGQLSLEMNVHALCVMRMLVSTTVLHRCASDKIQGRLLRKTVENMEREHGQRGTSQLK